MEVNNNIGYNYFNLRTIFISALLLVILIFKKSFFSSLLIATLSGLFSYLISLLFIREVSIYIGITRRTKEIGLLFKKSGNQKKDLEKVKKEIALLNKQITSKVMLVYIMDKTLAYSLPFYFVVLLLKAKFIENWWASFQYTPFYYLLGFSMVVLYNTVRLFQWCKRWIFLMVIVVAVGSIAGIIGFFGKVIGLSDSVSYNLTTFSFIVLTIAGLTAAINEADSRLRKKNSKFIKPWDKFLAIMDWNFLKKEK